MKNVLILFGGVSSEHAVSCVSAASVIANIPRDKYAVYMLGITKTGEWLLYEGGADALPDDKWLDGNCTKATVSLDRADHGILVFRKTGTEKIRIDAAFPVLHGKNGEDGTVQGVLEIAGIPYVGCGVRASAMCMDKAVTNLIADSVGVQQTPWAAITKYDYEKNAASFVEEAEQKLSYPMFVKPANAGSSVGISKVKTHAEFFTAMETAFKEDSKVVVEAAVQNALEAECAVLGNHGAAASVVGGIVPCKEFYDYEAKYIDEGSELQIPAHIAKESQAAVQQAAVKIFAALDCEGLARVDFFVEEDTGRVLFNEINTLPGFTSISMYPKLMEQSGVPYSELLDRLFTLAQEKEI